MRPSTPVNPDSGRMCWREPSEPRDERPMLRIRPFWSSEEEASEYLSAVRNNPRVVDVEADEIESPTAYIQRIAKLAQIATGKILPRPGQAFPPAHRMNREYTGPRPPIREGNLTFEDRLDVIYERQPGEEG